ncbi:DUF3343 domain-containing protein [Thermoanaerobacter kivui]|uniref:DUF3343 domain-containing protein n=1 Tax=Thermoanaerobacter kivui TaxID=2325 RepID=UPI000670E6FA|nr:DUF3343 domain-containing protein [Thermoanaerobacter kivui]
MKYGLIVFYSYQHGLMTEKILKKNSIPVEFVPTPRSITNSCSHSLKFGIEYTKVIKDILQRINIPYKGIYEVEKTYSGYEVINIL